MSFTHREHVKYIDAMKF